MDEKAAVEQHLRWAVRPDAENVPQHVFHRLERNQADGVIEEMHRHIGEHHQARRKPQLPDHRRAPARQCWIAKPLVTGACFLYPGAPRAGTNEPSSGSAGMLDIRHLVKSFGPLVAVDDVSFTVPQGEVLGFLGPNGAGKSTTMKMITGFLAPTAGTAIICGHDIATKAIAAKRCIGYLPEGAPAYPDMTPADFLDFIAHIRGFAGSEARRRIGS